MLKLRQKEIERLSEQLAVDPQCLTVCLEESLVEITEKNGQFDLQNGTILRLRHLQRICYTFEVGPQVALLLAGYRPHEK
jgi:hypothetical protein